jgi:intracellular septation protein
MIRSLTLTSAKQLTSTPNPNPSPKSQALSAFFGGLVPLIAFTLIEEKYGVIAGLVAGMVFGFGEVVYELIRYKKVSTITWIGNGMLIGLGAISLVSSDGIWFKLQPALLEYGFFIFLVGSWFIKKPFLKLMIEKQNPDAPQFLKDRMSGMTLRFGIFMLAHALLATYSAFYWSTEAWALLKGVGLTVSTVVFMVVEVLWTRFKIKKGAGNPTPFNDSEI